MGINQKRTKTRHRHLKLAKVDERQREAMALLRTCPQCDAQPTQRCRRASTGAEMGKVHPDRMASVRLASVPGGSW